MIDISEKTFGLYKRGIIKEILQLDTIDARLDNDETYLYLSAAECFIGITISEIKAVSDDPHTYSIRTNNAWVTIYKTVKSIHVSIHI